MYHNWYELSMVAKQVQKNLYRQADEARLVDAARKTRKEEKRRARQATTVVSAFATFVLQRNEVISIRVPRRSYRISCITGRLWTTINDSPADTILVAGETTTYCKSGKIVVQALRVATVRIECPSPSPASPGLSIRMGDRFRASHLSQNRDLLRA